MSLRPYQQSAVDYALNSNNTILVLPTGSGKSHVISGIALGLGGRTIVLQPTKEILESNYGKAIDAGIVGASIFSASVGTKEIGKVTYATIGSIIKQTKYLNDIGGVECIIIDECHLVNSKSGQYLEFIRELNPKKIIGLTATPYRLHSNSMGSQIKLLNRTRPKVFNEIGYAVQTQDLVKNNFLFSPTVIVSQVNKSYLKPNSTGAEYSDNSVDKFIDYNNINERCAIACDWAIKNGCKHILIFTQSLANTSIVLKKLESYNITNASIDGKTPVKEREKVLNEFKTGKIQAVVNVGVLTTGYDFPELDCIIVARPTLSLALHYQIFGRVVRCAKDKKKAFVLDLVDNNALFGNPLDMYITKNDTGLWDILTKNGRLTSTYVGDNESESTMPFGKYRGTKLKDLPLDYIDWYVNNNKKDALRHKLYAEKQRREIYETSSDRLSGN